MKSAKDFFAAANGKRVEKRVTGVLTIEAWPEWLAGTIAHLIDQGAKPEDIVTDDKGLRIKSSGQFVMRPKFRALETGVFTARSADYHFLPDGTQNPVYGDKKGAIVENGALVKRYPNGMEVTFRIEGN